MIIWFTKKKKKKIFGLIKELKWMIKQDTRTRETQGQTVEQIFLASSV
jgi:hypothetical protein